VTAGVLDCAFGTLGIGSPVSVTLSGTVPANAVGGTAFVLESNVETATTDPVSANDTATRSDAVAVVATLGLAVTITDSTPGSTEPGDILQAAFAVMPSEGRMIQFTYGPVSPVPRETLDELGLTVRRGGFAWWNIPPASVFVFQRSRSRPITPVRAGERNAGKE
jgi:hypothetical protein